MRGPVRRQQPRCNRCRNSATGRPADMLSIRQNNHIREPISDCHPDANRFADQMSEPVKVSNSVAECDEKTATESACSCTNDRNRS